MVMAHDRAAEIYAAWHLILQVSSRCYPRGSLLRDDGTPLTPGALAIKTRGRAEWFKIALEFLTVGPQWLETFDVSALSVGCQHPISPLSVHCQSGVSPLQEMDVEGKGTEGKGMEQNVCVAGQNITSPAPPPAKPHHNSQMGP